MTIKRVYDKEYNIFRDEVKKRDKGKCMMPGCRTPRAKKEVHHILPYSDNLDVRTNSENAILLCKNCHRSIKGKEYYFVKLFRLLVKQQYENNN